MAADGAGPVLGVPLSPTRPLNRGFRTAEGRYSLLQEMIPPPRTKPLPRTIIRDSQLIYIAVPAKPAVSLVDEPEVEYTDEESKVTEYIIVVHGDVLTLHSHNPVAKDPVSITRYKVLPTCIDINRATACPEALELLIGFATGDVVLTDLLRKRSLHFNKDNCICAAHATAVRWLPGSTNRFLVAYSDGTMYEYDRDRQDSKPTGEEGPAQPAATGFSVVKPAYKATALRNPMAVWRICQSPITGMCFSADGHFLAVVSRDGMLRIFDFAQELLVMSFKSYFGGFLCVAWSPDDRFIATGGEDDLVSLFSVRERMLVARGEGHRSWVSDVTFDETLCDGTTYRLYSAGQDCLMMVWDFSYATLIRPRIATSGGRRASVTSTAASLDGKPPPVVGRNEAATFEPILIHQPHYYPVSRVVCVPDSVVTSCADGSMKIWIRPPTRKAQFGSTLDLTQFDASSDEDVGEISLANAAEVDAADVSVDVASPKKET